MRKLHFVKTWVATYIAAFCFSYLGHLVLIQARHFLDTLPLTEKDCLVVSQKVH